MLKEAGCANIYHEQVTGTSTETKELLEAMSKGASLVVSKIERLARSIIDLHNTVNDLLAEDIIVRFLTDNLHFEASEKPRSI
ncbi:recombinase family protein [Paenibacillus sp. FSL E2-8871]|uniref:recombinase family protein n=1 Tax=Paenibacillus sp. FSL E2-8871 TaxID=2975326 RepID=UPI0030F79F42